MLHITWYNADNLQEVALKENYQSTIEIAEMEIVTVNLYKKEGNKKTNERTPQRQEGYKKKMLCAICAKVYVFTIK
jgi:hypothetical protein